ncbi:MAG: hypothetical protein JNN28_10530, partial [Saprospiraceae bacterium]|nr:hypothetical protein [Saprospiraceae bacterium]
ISLVFVSSACYSIQVDPDNPVPTVGYEKDIAPIIAANCGQSGCHGTERTKKFNLLGHSSLSELVTPYKPHDSELYKVIRLYSGGVMPPKPNDPLSDEQIGMIYVWILQGATEN